MRFSGFHFFSMVQIIKRYGFVVYPTNRRPVCTNQLKEAHAGGGTTMSVFRRDTSISALPRVWKHDASGDVLQGVCTRRQTDTSAGDYEEGRNETYEPGA